MASKFRNEEEVATADSWLALGQGREISAPEADALCPQWLTKEVDMLDIRPCPLNRCVGTGEHVAQGTSSGLRAGKGSTSAERKGRKVRNGT